MLTMGNVTILSPFSLFSRVLAAGNFGPAPEQSISPGDIPIGRLNSEEQALLTAWGIINVEIGNLAQAVASSKVENPGIEEMYQRAGILDAWRESLNRVFWATLCGRFSKKIESSGCDELTIRSDFQLVAYHKATALKATIVEVALPH